MVRDNRHESAYLFGAICPDHAVGAAMITPHANVEAMNLHLSEISTQVAPSARAVLVCDGAGWYQRGKQLQVPDNITLLTLPPYTPELIRWKTSVTTYGRTRCARPSGTHMTISSRPAKALGTRLFGAGDQGARGVHCIVMSLRRVMDFLRDRCQGFVQAAQTSQY
jgi:hypothetical protein